MIRKLASTSKKYAHGFTSSFAKCAFSAKALVPGDLTEPLSSSLAIFDSSASKMPRSCLYSNAVRFVSPSRSPPSTRFMPFTPSFSPVPPKPSSSPRPRALNRSRSGSAASAESSSSAAASSNASCASRTAAARFAAGNSNEAASAHAPSTLCASSKSNTASFHRTRLPNVSRSFGSMR